MDKELSASAIQIAEKKERIEKMFQLAQTITRKQTEDLTVKNPKLSRDDIEKQVRAIGIPKMAFLHEYIIEVSVSLAIAEGYFEHLAKRLNPNFVEFNPDKKAAKPTHFYVKVVYDTAFPES